MPRKYYIKCKNFSVTVETEYDRIIKVPPIVDKFLGKKFDDLCYWMKKFGGFEVREIVEKKRNITCQNTD